MEPEVRNKLDLAIEIRDVYAREILDFAGNPAIEVEVLAGGEIIGKASVAGKNYNKKEQTEKQQMDIEGKIELLNSQIAPEIIGENVFEQRKIDTILKETEMNRHPLQYHLQWRGQQRLQKKFRFTGILRCTCSTSKYAAVGQKRRN